MNDFVATFLRKFTFQRQLDIAIALGIFLLALFSSVIGSWQANERVRDNLLEQGQRITASLARQSALALIYASPDNANEAASATLNFPGVVSVEIRDVKQHVLLQSGKIDSTEFLTQVDPVGTSRKTNAHLAEAILDAESTGSWRFVAAVYSRPASTPFNEVAVPELLGHVTVVVSKAPLTQMTTGIFVANLGTSFSFALLFLLLIRLLVGRMTQPLDQLSLIMGRAEAGESYLRAELEGPKDIADMAHAFNSMISVLEGHSRKIRRLNSELERRVAQRTAQLESANKELEEFSYSMSHDMRTPLRALDGFSKILLDEHSAELDDEGKRLVKILRVNAQRMGRLVDDILHFLSMGRQKIQCISFDIGQMVADICAKMEIGFSPRRLLFKISELPPARGDSAMVREALQNLLSNAVKFSKADGDVLIEISGSAGQNENIYSVKDHGIGFDMRYADKLFKVFERVHATGQYEGSGIGLALVKRIITRHGGRVWAEGKVNEGATIYFALPTKENNHE
jgi:signal transduction histidine kinase